MPWKILVKGSVGGGSNQWCDGGPAIPGGPGLCGDAVYELFVRTLLIERGCGVPTSSIVRRWSLVRAEAQARFVQEILPDLTEDERELIRRGRNSKAGHVPKGVDPIAYRYSTGFEVLLGYLYLCGRQERLEEILAMSCR